MVYTHALAELHDQMDVSSLINDFVKFHNVWMPQVRKGIDLSVHCHLSLFVLQVLLIICLDGDNVLCHFVLSSSHDCERALADLKVYLEVF